MSDFDHDPLSDAFAGFRREVGPFVPSGDSAAVRTTVIRRRRVRAAATTVAALLVVAAPVTAYLMVKRQPSPPTDIGATTSASARPSGTVAASPITGIELDDATITLPAWAPDANVRGCPSGRVAFADGVHRFGDAMTVIIERTMTVNLDADPAEEAVIRVSCGTTGYDSDSTFQVVALDRDPGGAVRTLGQVTVQTGDIKSICGIRVGTGANIDVQVSGTITHNRCLYEPDNELSFQWRTFAWSGRGFVQTAGPTAFPSASASPR